MRCDLVRSLPLSRYRWHIWSVHTVAFVTCAAVPSKFKEQVQATAGFMKTAEEETESSGQKVNVQEQVNFDKDWLERYEVCMMKWHKPLVKHLRVFGFAVPYDGEHISGDIEGAANGEENKYLAWHLSRGDPKVICQTGFNYGTSALSFLCGTPASTRVYSWDIGLHRYTSEAHDWLMSQQEFLGRHVLTLGDSRDTLKHGFSLGADKAARCDSVFVDGGHTGDIAYSDIALFGNMVLPGALLLVDDCALGDDESGPAQAFQRAVDSALIQPYGKEFWHGGWRGGRSVCIAKYQLGVSQRSSHQLVRRMQKARV